ncbi:hypothetical protein QO002_001341 [Pararhizobium capsulatum DSM 1112]|uniref:Protoheme IX farnesyltransferase n=1 Tax=Pararhizobium capsulatum DSM 1112 TaxID=1121113 RepID=A0ABU0BLT3_9HYPH|nr:hypothetical protein [Pararhizobium capsulatum]MDQ0319203.1 hypothetical protein [Pararhizobium capsulatum DSM 1112]
MTENRRKARAIAIAKADDANGRVVILTAALLAFFAVAALAALSVF